MVVGDGIRRELLELALMRSDSFLPCKPGLMPVNVTFWTVVPWRMLIFGIGAKVGVVGCGTTVTVNVWVVRLLTKPPLFTVTVIVAVPSALVTGANESVPELFGLAYVTAGVGMIPGLL